MRRCSKTACPAAADTSCTFNYSTRQIWLTPLADDPDPASYSLCAEHAARFVAPKGWELTDLREERAVG